MFDLDVEEVFPQRLDLFSDDNELKEEATSGRLNVRKERTSVHRWRDDEIRVLLTAFTRHTNLTPDEVGRITILMRQGKTPSIVTKWIKSCRANQGKAVRQERARRRDARYTKAK